MPIGIVPIEQLITPTLCGEFLGVTPTAPTYHSDNTEHNGKAVTVYDKHRCIYFL